MRLLLYYIVHSFVNAIKKLFKSWVAIVIVISLAFGVVGGLTAVLISNMVDKSQEMAQDDGTQDVEDDEEEEEDKPEKTAEEWEIIYHNVSLVVLGLCLVILVANIYPGKRSGETLFSMADINMLLTAPIKPQTMLLYKTVMQMGLMLISTLYVMAQVPNLILNLKVPPIYAFYLIGVWLLISVFCKLSSILAYTLTAGKEWAKNIIRRGLPVIALILGIIIYVVMQKNQIGAIEAARAVLLSKPALCFPMIGWITGIADGVLTGNMSAALVYLVLVLVGFVVMVYIIWHVKVDFYEDCITKASNYFVRLEAAKDGMTVNRERKSKKKMKQNEIGKGQGASCFLVNQFYNRNRFAHLGILTNTGIMYLAVTVLGSLFLVKIAEVSSFGILGVILLVVCYIRNYGNPIARETEMSFLYMIPESAFSKLGYSIFGSSLIAALDLLPAVIVGGIMMKSDVWTCFCWFLLIVAFDFLLSNTGLLVDLLLPTYIPVVIKSMFAMFLKMFGITPLAIVLPLSIVWPFLTFIGVCIMITLGLVFLVISSALLGVGRR